MKKLIISAHPDHTSYSSQIAKSLYEKEMKQHRNVELLELSKLEFNPNYLGYSDKDNLEEAILNAQKSIKSADHIIIVTPIWWSTFPALFKGFLDKTLAPGFAFKFEAGKNLQTKLLLGKTAELVLLSDAPSWYRKFILRDPAATVLKRDILGFCGIKVKNITRIGSVGKLDQNRRKEIISRL